uniref:Uncharacterized protein n=1 Tax=Nomascus leucogenys TaxID=61853 RepID=G1QW65_NOMLE
MSERAARNWSMGGWLLALCLAWLWTRLTLAALQPPTATDLLLAAHCARRDPRAALRLLLPQPPLSCRDGGVRWSPACPGRNVRCSRTCRDGAAAVDTKSKPPRSHDSSWGSLPGQERLD